MTDISYIKQQSQIPQQQIQNTLALLKEGATIPFISRYRKEVTGNLDEVAIQNIQKNWENYQTLEKRKEAILKSIEEQSALTVELGTKIKNCFNTVDLEDLYLPFKKKRQTKASIAQQNGLLPLAKIIMAQREKDVSYKAQRFINKEIPTTEEAIQGAQYIIADWVNEHLVTRNTIRKLYQRKAIITAKVIKNKEKLPEAQVYDKLFAISESLHRVPSHRLLAILRAEKEGILRVKISIDKEEALDRIDRYFIKSNNKACTDIIFKAISNSYSRLLAPSLANEALQEVKLKAELTAIEVFNTNLKQLLLATPLGEKRIMGIDPGFKSGCKIVCLDARGALLYNSAIYPHPPQSKTFDASKIIKELIHKYQIEAIAIGNGTASRETERFIKNLSIDDVDIFVVNESGASVYSASAIAREEFPNHDVTVRGAVSIGRRLSDPLAELVKIDPKSLGVGQYQHDVNQTLLKKELDSTVMHCVNSVGINVNTASTSLLSYVSGIGTKLAQNIINYREENKGITSRIELKNVKGLGAKAYEQSVAFLRIKNGTNALDNSGIHPERYNLVKQIAKNLNINIPELLGNKQVIESIEASNYITHEVGLPTLNDIKKELLKPGLDPRETISTFEFDQNIKTINDVKIGMKLPGIVNNITNFGCFVDIGIKQSGLIHISKLANRFVQNPNDIVKLNQQVVATVIQVDEQKNQIALSLVD